MGHTDTLHHKMLRISLCAEQLPLTGQVSVPYFAQEHSKWPVLNRIIVSLHSRHPVEGYNNKTSKIAILFGLRITRSNVNTLQSHTSKNLLNVKPGWYEKVGMCHWCRLVEDDILIS